MRSTPEHPVAPRLAGRALEVGDDPAFILGEWSDDGSRPGAPIAPLHRHLDEDEAWYVLEGKLRIRLGDTEVIAEAGAGVFGPKGIPHTFTNPEPVHARYLVVMQPRTWSLLVALHDPASVDVDANGLYRAHGAELL